jgi:uncharacterized damage-inducible protein DinB
MSDSLADRYRRWFDYEKDAHRKVLESLPTVPEARRGEPSFQKAVDLLAHVVAARQMWLHRLGALAKGPTELFPAGVRLEELLPRMEEMERAWSRYLQRLDADELGRVFEYRAWEGERFRNTVEDTLTQLFGHSLYHRGQIAAAVRSLGGRPAVTDFVFWTREPV